MLSYLRKLIKKAEVWIKDNPREALIISVILLVGAFFRFYRIGEYMIFLGDEGRDAIIVRRLLVDFDPILIGPGTSIGNMYLGPLYYYLIAPSLLLANFSPVGPSAMIAALGVITIFLVWLTAREWFGKSAAFIAALLYSISPIVITFSKSSWNPNIMPFFALISLYSIWKVWQFKEFKWLVTLGAFFAIILQSHYLGLLLAPTLFLFWFLTYLKIRYLNLTGNWKLEFRKFLRNSFWGLTIFASLMSPLVIFDARHEWRNFGAIKLFFLERQTTVSARPWSGIPKIPELIDQANLSLLSSQNADISWIYTYLFYTGFIVLFGYFLLKGTRKVFTDKEFWSDIFKKLDSKSLAPYFLILAWIGVSFVGLSLYKQHIYDHYFGFFFPAPFLLVGAVSQYVLKNSSRLVKTALVVFLIYAVYVNLSNSPIKYPPNRQMQRAEGVAREIQRQANGEKFNLAVLAERNYEDGYQYFLEKWNEPVYDIDPLKLEETLADQLFVVCELPKEKCDPTHSPKAEVANFGWSEIEEEWEVSGVIVYKLTHSK